MRILLRGPWAKKSILPTLALLSAIMLIILFLQAASGALPEKDVTASLKLEKQEATIGEKVLLELKLEGLEGIRFDIPDLRTSLLPLVVSDLHEEPEEIVEGKLHKKIVLKISSYETGSIGIPELEIGYSLKGEKGAVKTERSALTIRSVLRNEQEGMADIKGPARLSPDYAALIVLLLTTLAVLGAGALIYYMIRRYRKREKIIPLEDIFSRIPPHEWAYAELDRLLSKKFLEIGLLKEFYASLSGILKKYLEGRYRVDAMEKTTEEVAEMLYQAKLEREIRAAVESILKECDMVKFARHLPPQDGSKRIIQAVYGFIDRTKPRYERVGGEQIVVSGGGK